MPGIDNISFRYDSEKKIMYKLHYGDIAIEDIINSWEWAFDNKIIPENTKCFLLDYRDAIITNAIKSSSDIVKLQ